MHDPIDGPVPPASRSLLDPAFCLLAGAVMAVVLCGLWVWWVAEARHRPEAPQPRPRPTMMG